MRDGPSRGAGTDTLKMMREVNSVEIEHAREKKKSPHNLNCLKNCAWKALHVLVSVFLKRMLELYEDTYLPVIQTFQNNTIKI